MIVLVRIYLIHFEIDFILLLLNWVVFGFRPWYLHHCVSSSIVSIYDTQKIKITLNISHWERRIMIFFEYFFSIFKEVIYQLQVFISLRLRYLSLIIVTLDHTNYLMLCVIHAFKFSFHLGLHLIKFKWELNIERSLVLLLNSIILSHLIFNVSYLW